MEARGAAEAKEEVALILAVANGDRGALAKLYDRYAPLCLGLAQRILGGADRAGAEAEDLVHDVFLEMWRCAGDYDVGRGSVRTWLLMRLRSRALDRRKSPAFTRSQSLEDTPEQEGVSEDPSLGPDRAAVRRALTELPPEQRQVLELGYFEGLSSTEIAAKTGVPVGTVKSRVAAALHKLRAEIARRAT